MRTDNIEKVLEKLATTDKSTLVVSKEPEGKARVASGSWQGDKVFFVGWRFALQREAGFSSIKTFA